MHPAQYAQMLSDLIDGLDAEIRELQPSWDVPSLQRSYVQAEVYSALRDLYDGDLYDGDLYDAA